MLGKATGALGVTDDLIEKISESGIDLSSLMDLDPQAVNAMLEENGIDLSMLEGLGLSVEDIIAKIKDQIG